jgi:hypothetical protein
MCLKQGWQHNIHSKAGVPNVVRKTSNLENRIVSSRHHVNLKRKVRALCDHQRAIRNSDEYFKILVTTQ